LDSSLVLDEDEERTGKSLPAGRQGSENREHVRGREQFDFPSSQQEKKHLVISRGAEE
jgi:hypothetical protein